MNKFDQNFPNYNDDSDYNTNANSYYKDLGRKTKLIKLLAKRIWEYDNTLNETLEQIEQRLTDYILENDLLMNERLKNWDKRIDEMPEEMKSLFITWLNDGTLEQIINDDVLGNKADKSYVDELNNVLVGKSDKTYVDELNENVTTQLTQTIKWVNVKNFGAKGDGETFDSIAINEAIAHAKENGLHVYIPRGTYLIDEPIHLQSRVNVLGDGVNETNLHKTTTNQNSDGVNAVMYGRSLNNFKLMDFTLIGDRKPYAEGNQVTTDGLHLQSCSYFKVENIRATNCKKGFVSITNWCCVYERPVAVMCQNYAFHLYKSSTSHVVIQPTSWGCGGGFRLSACIYTTIINPSNDHSDAGGRPDDPFLPQGSGGDYQNPEYIFRVVGSSVTIIGSGTEDSSSQYIYNEGSNIELINPYIWRNITHKTGSKFIQTRGTSRSLINITNPDFRNVETTVTNSTTNFLYFEDTEKQKIKLNRSIIPHSSFGDYEISHINGLIFTDTEKIVNITKENVFEYMNIPFEYDEDVFNLYPNNKKLSVRKTATGTTSSELLTPIEQGDYLIKLKGTSNSQYAPVKVELVERQNDTTTVIHEFTMNNSREEGGVFRIDSDNYFFRIRLTHETDVLDFETLIIEKIL